jgi:DNA primase
MMTHMLVLVSIQERIYLIVLRVVCRATVYKSLQSKRGWTYVKQSLSQKELLGRATAKYAANIHLAEGYLASRGITREVARLARFGVVSEPEVGHEAFIGRLSIPYITKTGVVDLRFRSLNPAVEPKYMGMTGVETKMYNVIDIDRAGDWIGVCEGELDTITLSGCVGIPCIGVPGANSWKKHYTRLLADFERVFVFADGDQPGKEFATSLARELPVTVVQFPDGEDVNSAYVKYGADYIRERAGLDE